MNGNEEQTLGTSGGDSALGERVYAQLRVSPVTLKCLNGTRRFDDHEDYEITGGRKGDNHDWLELKGITGLWDASWFDYDKTKLNLQEHENRTTT